MSLPKLIGFFALILFSIIGFMTLYKKREQKESHSISSPQTIEIEIEGLKTAAVIPLQKESSSLESEKSNISDYSDSQTQKKEKKQAQELPEADRIAEFFNLENPKFPIIETITYKSRVPWLKGRPAWLSDYASHFKTSRHFIARSLNGKPDYLKQDLVEGARFNILNPDKNIQFHLIIDTSRCKMWFYYHDLDSQEKVLVKTYQVGLGRTDHSKISGLLTPLGVYSLGSRVATYKPKVMGMHNGEKIEMVRVFGTRWIPFEKEIQNTTAPAKGFGLHGLPWIIKNGELIEDTESLGKYESDGCIRMNANDIEEIYAIIITRPTTIEIVKDFFDAQNNIH